MNTLQKKILIPMAAVAVVGAGVYGVSQASADSNTNSNDPRASLIQKLADTFHLDKNQVQAVFDQNQNEQQTKREQNYENRLSQAVTDGKLTSAQKDAILTEHKQLQSELEAAKDKTPTDRRAAMKQVRDEAKSWAGQHNIDEKWLIGPGRLRGGMGTGGPGDGQPPADSSGAPAGAPDTQAQ